MKNTGTRNPSWSRDELILALDLYFRHNPAHISKNHPEIIKLSEILNKLPIHDDKPNIKVFRNTNGVYMKLCNFLRLDPKYKGTGLKSGGKLEEKIWDEFSQKKEELSQISKLIINNYDSLDIKTLATSELNSEFGMPEGKLITRLHKSKERSRALVNKKKEQALRNEGNLQCEACGFDFLKSYGSLGKGFIECHHTTPISMIALETTTKLKDLALVCSNCHRMLHRIRPWLTIDQLKNIMKQNTSKDNQS
ncbi:HNH endonuclease [Salidesulfovibrio brasiliensis]|uniref:HNH endonuclease n=1 Tax=Salidesulfovibrio brasiliensis TaxID=221711 RepID=UPI0009FAFCD9|nr:HNH endonuclease [Salidesulfovibrio brasiliensis]